ncbi:MAG: arylsulfatase A-like enzyme [Myxococcota bacterium]|jgi:arylsulfatase A-like enzyme
MLTLALLTACTPTAAEPPTSPPPVIIISIDTLRADRLGAWGNPDGLTASLDRFASESVSFTRTWAPSNETLFSHAALFTGRYPSELSAVDYNFAFPDQTPTLAGVLGVYGYTAGAFVGGGHLSPAFGLDAGFADYTVSAEWGSLYHSVPQALSWLDSLTEAATPFLFIHGYDPHHRYLKPTPWGYAEADASYSGLGRNLVRSHAGTAKTAEGHFFARRRFDQIFDFSRLRVWDTEARQALRSQATALNARPLSAADADHITDAYDGAVRYGDAWFGLLMAGLQDRGLTESALIIVLSDHGEGLGEDGVFNHRPALSEEMLHVPLMIRPPGGVAAARVETTTSLVDVMPTVLEAIGGTLPAQLAGRSLWGAVGGEPLPPTPAFAETAFRQLAVRTDDGGLVFSGASPHSPFLPVLLATSRLDGPAFESLDGGDPAVLRQALIDWREQLDVRPLIDGEISPERLKILQERGYWGGQ